MSLASMFDFPLYHMDVKKYFPNGLIKEEEYGNQPRGFEVHGLELGTHVCRLKKALYGLK